MTNKKQKQKQALNIKYLFISTSNYIPSYSCINNVSFNRAF